MGSLAALATGVTEVLRVKEVERWTLSLYLLVEWESGRITLLWSTYNSKHCLQLLSENRIYYSRDKGFYLEYISKELQSFEMKKM